MKQFRKWFNKSKKKYSHVSPNEIDCGIAWRAALEWLYGKLGYSTEHKELKDIIAEELEGGG